MGIDTGMSARPVVSRRSWVPGPAVTLLFPIALIVLIGVIAVAYWAGQANAGSREVEASCAAGPRKTTCDVTDEDDPVRWSGAVRWLDGDGDWHDGRPACLERGRETDVLLGVVDVEHDEGGWTEVLWVDCRD